MRKTLCLLTFLLVGCSRRESSQEPIRVIVVTPIPSAAEKDAEYKRLALTSGTWRYASGDALLSSVGLGTDEDYALVGRWSVNKDKDKRPQYGGADPQEVKAGRTAANKFNDQMAAISIMDPEKARGFRVEFLAMIWRSRELAGRGSYSQRP